MSTVVVPSDRTDNIDILYDVEYGLSEENYAKAYKKGYLFRHWTPQFLTTDYHVSYSLPEDIYGALIASFVSLDPGLTACQRACGAVMALTPGSALLLGPMYKKVAFGASFTALKKGFQTMALRGLMGIIVV